ncbi:MAG: hypothetical protein IJQ77_00060, partial [Synergistaceae bacterium]|nr:hypothetical protein [Synergistaceae bacterium]
MKHRFIVPALMLLLAVFIFSITGCGGSSKSISSSPEKEEEQESTLSLKAKEREAYTEALDTFYERLKAEGTYEKFMSSCDYIVMYPPTELFEFYPEHKSEESISVPLDEAAEVIAEVVKPRYDEGQIIYMLSPTQDNLDVLLRGIDETSPYTEPANSDEPIYALYAITKRYASNGTKHVFTYEIPC